jgi:putative endonuclease
MRTKGNVAEKVATDYLIQQGLTLVTHNFHSRQGEIDMIMMDNNTVVFVEVKYRQQSAYGHANEMVSITKQQKIRHTASFYLQQQQLNVYNTPCRFDVVAIEGNLLNPQIQWLKNAF